MKTGNGKIANLPAETRDELNYRIAQGDEGIELVEWLNAKPEVAEVVNKLFDGVPISEQNLSEWRKRGYQKWLAYHNIVDESNAVSGNTDGIAATGIDCDKLFLTLTGAYAEAIQRWMITPCDQMNHKLGVYKNITNGVIAMRRAELLKVRLEIDRERLEILREKRLNKSASSVSSRVSGSADTVSPEDASATSPARPEPPEPHHSAMPAPPPCDERTAPQETPEPPLPAPANVAANLPTPLPTSPAQTAAPTVPTPTKPVTPQEAPLWPTRRPGGPPRNASPRNPLGLL